MAAAYLFHVVKNHPFLNGNKRTGSRSSLTFLAINGLPIPPPTPILYSLTIAVAEGQPGKGASCRSLAPACESFERVLATYRHHRSVLISPSPCRHRFGSLG